MMTTVKVKFRPSTVASRPGSIIYLVTRHRTVRQITTNYKLFPSEWDERKSKIIPPFLSERADIVKSIMKGVYWDVERLNALIAKYDKCSYDYTSDEIVAEFLHIVSKNSLFIFMENVIAKQKRMNHTGTADNYQSALNSFRRFRKGEDIHIGMVDHKLMEEYQDFLKSTGITPNSISFYMRILRAVYSRAVSQELTVDRKPFRSVFTGMEKTRKRAISIQDIRRIRKLDLYQNPGLNFARDVFMFLFLCRGMSFVDAAFLKKTDIHDGVISYRRRKTGQLLHIRIVSEIRELIDRYSIEKSPYLLPIIDSPGYNERKQYESALRKVNKNLKIIAGQIDIPVPLTTYVARHAWATIAKTKNVPLNVISDALGHNSVVTTQIYLASIDASIIDNANDLIIKDL